jgi:hypothetical protein
MNRYVIERDLPGAGSLSSAQIRAASQISNRALSELGGGVQWVQSHVTADRIYCVYLAANEEMIREHARLSGLPANVINKVYRIIDPQTAALT